MSWLIELAFSMFLFWPAALAGVELDRPMAFLEMDCSCNPCVCKEKCSCTPCQCDSCPGKPGCAGCPGKTGCSSCPAGGACKVPTCAVTSSTTSVARPTPTAPRCYEVHVRVLGDGCCKKIVACPSLCLTEGGKAIVSCNTAGKDGKPCCHLMHVQVAGVDRNRVKVHLQMSGANPPCRMEGVKTVHLNTVTGVVLSGCQAPEPCCAEVTVRPVRVPMPVATIMPHPMPVHVHQPMPAPAPICCPLPPAPPLVPPVAWHGPAMVPIMSPPTPAIAVPPTNVIHPVKHIVPVRMSCVELCKHDGKSRLHLKSHDGMTSKCVRMTLECHQTGTLQLAAGKKYVHITGKEWKASADHIAMHDNGRIVLTGHVKLQSDHIGCCASVKADRLCIQVKGDTGGTGVPPVVIIRESRAK